MDIKKEIGIWNPGLQYWANVFEEVKYAAKWCKERGLKGEKGNPLPNLISLRAFRFINNNPEYFKNAIKNA